MDKIAKAVYAIKSASATSTKLRLLMQSKTIPGFMEAMRFIYNPYIRTGISKAKLLKAMSSTRVCTARSLDEVIDYFSTHTTGTDADLFFAATYINYIDAQYETEEVTDIAKALIMQDLKMGVSVTTLNKAYGANFIPKIGCMLGTLFGDVGPAKTHWPCIVTEKLDGIRRILVKENGVCRFFSRSGHEDTGLVDILKEAAYLPNNTVYDGELLACGDFKDCIAQRQATNSIANSKGVKVGLTYNVFDMIPLSDFKAGKSKEPAYLRKLLLGATLMDESIQHLHEDWPKLIQAYGVHEELQYIKPVPILGVVHNITEADPIVSEIWSRGGEGIMLNTKEGKYEIKRSKELLKVKHTEEHQLPVVDMVEGDGKFAGMLGALVVEYTHSGGKSYLGVGSGLTEQQRREIWSNPEKYMNRLVEIETFGESTNSSGGVSLNCPIFKRFVGEEE